MATRTRLTRRQVQALPWRQRMKVESDQLLWDAFRREWKHAPASCIPVTASAASLRVEADRQIEATGRAAGEFVRVFGQRLAPANSGEFALWLAECGPTAADVAPERWRRWMAGIPIAPPVGEDRQPRIPLSDADVWAAAVRAARPVTPEARGVYLGVSLEYAGSVAIRAVDSHGQRVAETQLCDDPETWATVARGFWDLLDRCDPPDVDLPDGYADPDDDDDDDDAADPSEAWKR